MAPRYVAVVKSRKGYIAIDAGKHTSFVTEDQKEAYASRNTTLLAELAEEIGINKDELEFLPV